MTATNLRMGERTAKMISAFDDALQSNGRDRVLVVTPVADDRALARQIGDLYPDLAVARCDTYLAGIADLTRNPSRAVIAWVDGSMPRLSDAVAGLREAAGGAVKLLLCCRPEYEPLARDAVGNGADDYLLYPLERSELDRALDYHRLEEIADELPTTEPLASMEELGQLGDALTHLADHPSALLQQLAQLVHGALPAKGVTIIVEGAVATSGDPVTRPILSAPLKSDDRVIGQLTVGEPAGRSFVPADAEKLARYAELLSGVLQAGSDFRHWRQLAMTDETSGLGNRRYLYEKLDAILERATLQRHCVTVLLFDVDDFKSYNDEFGHDAGDEIIRMTGELMSRHCRDHDIVARYGGDEFAVVFWDPDGPRSVGSHHPDGALEVMERFRAALTSHEFPKLGPTGQGRLTISGGLATFPWDGKTRDELLNRADEALLGAKRAGKNRIFLIGGENNA